MEKTTKDRGYDFKSGGIGSIVLVLVRTLSGELQLPDSF